MNSSDRTVALRCGTLHLHVERAEMELDRLCGYSSRRSRKRGFVFVSKVLGKHYPVRPRCMADGHARLAAKLADLPGPAVLIALAETATGLGQGVYEEWLRQTGRNDILFLHTTRYRMRQPLALCFQESHSHATEHLVHEAPDADCARLFRQARCLVLVDDEISTGRTLANLAAAYRQVNGRLTAVVHFVCLTDWLSAAQREDIAGRIGLPTVFHSLLRGSFTLKENSAFDPGTIPDVVGRGDCKEAYLPVNHGRLGLRGVVRCDLDALIAAANIPGPHTKERLLVLGTGEFTYPPYILARRLEALGHDVHYQSTTRSPLLLDGDISSALEFVDNYHDGIPNYLYNVSDRRYDRVLIGYETRQLPAAHFLPEMIGATPIFFPRAV